MWCEALHSNSPCIDSRALSVYRQTFQDIVLDLCVMCQRDREGECARRERERESALCYKMSRPCATSARASTHNAEFLRFWFSPQISSEIRLVELDMSLSILIEPPRTTHNIVCVCVCVCVHIKARSESMKKLSKVRRSNLK